MNHTVWTAFTPRCAFCCSGFRGSDSSSSSTDFIVFQSLGCDSLLCLRCTELSLSDSLTVRIASSQPFLFTHCTLTSYWQQCASITHTPQVDQSCINSSGSAGFLRRVTESDFYFNGENKRVLLSPAPRWGAIAHEIGTASGARSRARRSRRLLFVCVFRSQVDRAPWVAWRLVRVANGGLRVETDVR